MDRATAAIAPGVLQAVCAFRDDRRIGRDLDRAGQCVGGQVVPAVPDGTAFPYLLEDVRA
ncbi:hypothetical protein GCM10027572_12220 [Flexivirga lutea]